MEPKLAQPHFQHHHKHQHGLVLFHTHEHGIKPGYDLHPSQYNPGPQTQIFQNQQTIIHESKPSLLHQGGSSLYEHQQQFGFNPTESHLYESKPNTHISINQNQIANGNILKSPQIEDELGAVNPLRDDKEFIEPQDELVRSETPLPHHFV